jgi:SAM-dependent methyltransferase
VGIDLSPEMLRQAMTHLSGTRACERDALLANGSRSADAAVVRRTIGASPRAGLSQAREAPGRSHRLAFGYVEGPSRHAVEKDESVGVAQSIVAQGDVAALPVRSSWADITICGLVLGHLPHLAAPFCELRRITRPGGLIICSDFHPVGATLGWTRDFKAGGQRYAVRHTTHSAADWQEAAAKAGLAIDAVIEPHLDPADIPPVARFDRRALDVPVVIVYALRRTQPA